MSSKMKAFGCRKMLPQDTHFAGGMGLSTEYHCH